MKKVKEKKLSDKQKKEFILLHLLKKYLFIPVAKPKTTSQVMQTFFKEYNEDNSILQLDENHFSVCFEYQNRKASS